MNRDLFIVLVLSLSIHFAKVLAVDVCENQLDGTRLALPADCTKFVVCRQSQIERILTCPLGLHFNRFNSICDMRERAACQATFVKSTFNKVTDCTSCSSGCGSCGDTPTPGGEDNVSGAGKNTSNNGGSVGPSTGPSGTTCVNSGNCIGQPDGKMFADPKTTGYIVCQCECQNEMPCAPGTKFDESLNTCNHINVGDSGSGGGANGRNCDNPGKCAGQPNGAALPNPNTNTGYLQCQNECEVEKSCAPGTIFDESLVTCVNVNDKSGTCGTSGIKCRNPGKCAGKSDGTTLPALNATSFIVCLCECELVRSCAPDTIYQESLSVCVHVNGSGSDGSCESSGVKCNNPGKCASEPDGAIFANPNTTFGYIECKCECELEKLCVPGTIFNKGLKFCVHVNDNRNVTNCSGGEAPSGIEGGTGGKGNISGGSSGSGDSGGDEGTINEGAGGGDCVTEKVKCDNPGKCASQPDGAIFANPNTTTGYFECKCECELEKSCVPNTIFSEALKFCTHVNGVGGPNGEDNSNGKICSGEEGASGSESGTSDSSGDDRDPTCCGGCAYTGGSDGSDISGSHPGGSGGVVEQYNSGESGDMQGTGGCSGSVSPADKCDCTGFSIGEGGSNGSGVTCGAGSEDNNGGSEGASGCEGKNGSGIGIGGKEGSDSSVETGGKGDISGTEIEGCGVCKTPGKCIDKSDGTMFTSLDSTGYIVCMCGCQVERPCAPGTIFNETLKTCIHIDCETVDNGSGCSSGEGGTDSTGSAIVPAGTGGSDDTSVSGGTVGDSGNGITQTGSIESFPLRSNAGIDGPSTVHFATTCVNSAKCVQQPDGAMFRDPNSTRYIVLMCCQNTMCT